MLIAIILQCKNFHGILNFVFFVSNAYHIKPTHENHRLVYTSKIKLIGQIHSTLHTVLMLLTMQLSTYIDLSRTSINYKQAHERHLFYG